MISRKGAKALRKMEFEKSKSFCAFAPLRDTYRLLILAFSMLLLSGNAIAEEPLDGEGGRPLALDQYRPKSQLALPENRPQRAKFPVVDAHLHPRLKFRHVPVLLDAYVRVIKRAHHSRKRS